jgi:hypothetical protein
MEDRGHGPADASDNRRDAPPELTSLMSDADLTAGTPQVFQDNESQRGSSRTPRGDSLLGEAIIALTASILLIALTVLQLIGLQNAVEGRRQPKVHASWCSPIFQAFAITVVDGNCNVHQLTPSASKGIGCILIPGDYQNAWLTVTVALLSVSLIFQCIDILLLVASEGRDRCRGAKLQRPWFSMFTGILILFILLLFGVFTASTMPPHTTEGVTVFRVEPSLGGMTACRGKLTPAGVRGSILGWTDGFLHCFNATYYGQPVA